MTHYRVLLQSRPERIVWGRVVIRELASKTFDISYSLKKKLQVVKLEERGGHAISPFREMTRPENNAFIKLFSILLAFIHWKIGKLLCKEFTNHYNLSLRTNGYHVFQYRSRKILK